MVVGAVVTAVRRMPFTYALILTIVVVAILSGALHTPAEDSGLVDTYGYGVPSLQEGRVWTFVTGTFLGLAPSMYLAITAITLVGCGLYECVAGTKRVAIVFTASQVGGNLVSAALTWLLSEATSWQWAIDLALELDVGCSAGAFGALAAWTFHVRPRWRAALRLLLFAYLIGMLAVVSLVWDLEHVLAAIIGLVLGPVLARGAPVVAAGRTWHG